MQVSSINFSANYKRSGLHKATHNHQARKNQHEYTHVKNEYDKKHTKQTFIRLAALASAGIVGFFTVSGLVGEANDNDNNNYNQPSSSIYQEGEMPSASTLENEQNIQIEQTPQDIVIEEEENNDEIKSETDFKIILSQEQKNSVEKFVQNWEENSDRYFNMEEKTGVPAELIAAVHWRESTGDFDTYLHNGAKLGYTIDTYFGKRWYDNWEDAAYDALTTSQQVEFDENNLQTYYDFAEMYNGTGYSDYYNINSPYVWAGTDKYTCGKYVEDGKFDPYCVDQQPGVAVLLNEIMS